MKNNTMMLLKCLMWMVCAFHILVGAGLNLIPEVSRLMADVYGAQVNWTPEFSYILKPLGAFMFALGLLAAAAAINPTKNRVIMYAFAVLFLIRAVQRVVWSQEINEVFSIAAGRNWSNVVFFVLLAGAVIVLDILAHKRQDASVAVTS